MVSTNTNETAKPIAIERIQKVISFVVLCALVIPKWLDWLLYVQNPAALIFWVSNRNTLGFPATTSPVFMGFVPPW